MSASMLTMAGLVLASAAGAETALAPDSTAFWDATAQREVAESVVVIVVMGVFGLVAVVAVVMSCVTAMVRARATEQSRRELAAYVAEGSISADDAEKLLSARPLSGCERKKKEDRS